MPRKTPDAPRKRVPAKKAAAPRTRKGARVGVPVDAEDRRQHRMELVGGTDVDKRRPARARTYMQVEGKMAEVLMGTRSVTEMDTEELKRMQWRDKNGKFSGRPPNHLPRQLVEQMRQEMLRRADFLMHEDYQELVRIVLSIAQDPDEKAADRLKAVQFISDRFAGPVTQRVEVSTGEKGFEVTMARGIKRLVEEGDVVDAEVVDE